MMGATVVELPGVLPTEKLQRPLFAVQTGIIRINDQVSSSDVVQCFTGNAPYSVLCSALHKADYVDCSIMWT